MLAGRADLRYNLAVKKTANTIKELLEKSRTTVSTAESISGGHLQSMLTAVSGASAVFKGGITAYQLPVKVELLNVDPALAEKTDCVDEEVARQMALGALKLFKTDYALATCGYAELAGGKPYAFFAIAQAPGTILYSGQIELSGNRVEAQQQTAETTLEKFNALLQSLPCG